MTTIHLTALCCLLLWALFQVGSAGNCSSLPTIILSRQGSQYEVGSLSLILRPTTNGVPIPGSQLEWKIFSLIERTRSTKDVSGSQLGTSLCLSKSESEFRLDERPDPFFVSVPTEKCINKYNVPCGELLRVINATDLDCWNERIVAPFFNTTRETVFVHYSHPSFPDFSMKAGFHLTDDFITIYPLPNSTMVKNSYNPSMIKLSYEVYNFPWLGPRDVITGPRNNASYFSIWFENNIEIQAGNLTVDWFGENRVVTYSSTDGLTNLKLEVDSAYILDGEPWLHTFEPGGFSFVSESALPPFSMYSTVTMCAPPVSYWSSAIYDPSIGYLFSGDSMSPQAASQKKGGGLSSVGLAMIILFSIVAVFVVVGAVLAFYVIPKMRSSSSARLGA